MHDRSPHRTYDCEHARTTPKPQTQPGPRPLQYCWQLKATTSKITKDIRMQAPITVSMALPGPEAADTVHPLDPALDNPPPWCVMCQG